MGQMDLERMLADLRQRKRSIRPEELHQVLLAAGFERRFGRGDHWVYSHPKRLRGLVVDPRTPLLIGYVVMALRAIEEVME